MKIDMPRWYDCRHDSEAAVRFDNSIEGRYTISPEVPSCIWRHLRILVSHPPVSPILRPLTPLIHGPFDRRCRTQGRGVTTDEVNGSGIGGCNVNRCRAHVGEAIVFGMRGERILGRWAHGKPHQIE
jgi:hypothetical protein